MGIPGGLDASLCERCGIVALGGGAKDRQAGRVGDERLSRARTARQKHQRLDGSLLPLREQRGFHGAATRADGRDSITVDASLRDEKREARIEIARPHLWRRLSTAVAETAEVGRQDVKPGGCQRLRE